MQTLTSKIIQIQTHHSSHQIASVKLEVITLTALCDDGTVWVRKVQQGSNSQWLRIDN